MVMTASNMLTLGTELPDFELRDPEGKIYTTDFASGKPLLIIFMCNHCPFVIHVREKMVELIKEYQAKGIEVIGINSNINPEYPEDSAEKMLEYREKYGYTFDYLVDSNQEIAKLLHAACTPDFFLFDKEHYLIYRGQMDDSRPGNDLPITGADLRKALDALLAGRAIPEDQKPSMGCNIKWCPGNEPKYFAA